MADPSNFITNPPSTVVKVKGTAREDVNGKLGIAVQFDADRGRYLVHMVSTQTTMALKPENLEKAGMFDTAKAQMEHIRKDPNIQREISKYYSMAQRFLGGVKPEYAGVGLVALCIVGMYFVGFTKIMMAVSLLLMLGMIIGPDIVQGLPMQIVAQNFPRRSRETLEINLPILKGRISDQVAAGIVLAMLGLGLVLLFSGGAASKAAAAAASSRAAPMAAPLSTSKESLEAAYKLGFEDATGGMQYGHSLSMIEDDATSSAATFDDDQLEFADAPLPPEKKSSFGLTQGLSLFYIYRMAMELGGDGAGGAFSMERMIANLKTAGVMKLGILGFSVFNVVRPFLNL